MQGGVARRHGSARFGCRRRYDCQEAFGSQARPADQSPAHFVAGEQIGGVSTGEQKIYTSKRTTGIVDAAAPRIFEDVTSQTGINGIKCVSGGKAKEYIVETTACTIAIIDYDNDGKPDIFFLNGSTINAELGKEKPPRSYLFHNLGNWKFEDVTASAGVGGAPADATLTLSLYIYNLTFRFMPSFGYAATISWVIVILVGLLSWVQFQVAKEKKKP